MVSTTYNFTNQPTTVTRKQWTSASTSYPNVTVYNKYLYDQVGRKLKTWEQITNTNLTADTLRLISQTNYNEIGQVYQKQLDSKDSVNFQQSIAYTYNERGWLLTSTAALFQMQLEYNTNTISGATISARYNGDIAAQGYGTQAAPNGSYFTYNYDKINRILAGVSSAGFTENQITYDVMGNLSSLYRYTTGGTEIDQLGYSYTLSGNPTNQLQSVADATSNTGGLQPGTTNYTYDGNGNMLSATNTANTQGNKSFTYNLLNLPATSTFYTGSATFAYDAAGTKLRKASTAGTTTTYTDYISGIQYNGASSESIQYVMTEEGQAAPIGTSNHYDYEYFLGDNLGNTRRTFDVSTGTARLTQTDDYYPFGLEINTYVYGTKNYYLYNKKELQPEFSEYDYGARFYDPVIGRWTSVDPLAETSRRWSTYNYVTDNPIRLIDPDGMDQASADAMNALQTGTLGDGTGTNTLVYSASGDEQQPPKKKSKADDKQHPSSNTTAKADAAKTVSATSKPQPLKGTPPPPDQGTIQAWPPPEQVNYQDLGLASTSSAIVTNVVNTYGAVAGFSELKAAMLGVDVFEVAANGETAATKLGREMHALYKAGLADGETTFKEFTGIKGIRPDFVDFGTKTIYELKPNNIRAIVQGVDQLNTYKAAFETQYGGTWNIVLDTY